MRLFPTKKLAPMKQKLNAHYIKNSLNPVEFYRHELPNVPLKKHGWNNGGLCVFHADNKLDSFRVNLMAGAFKCSSCGMAGGDIFAFVMVLHGIEFVEALIKLADNWGLLYEWDSTKL